VSDASVPLKPHLSDSSLSGAKLKEIEKKPTEELIESLVPGQRDSLKTRPDGTILDGHHRIFVLRLRSVNFDVLPREVVEKEY